MRFYNHSYYMFTWDTRCTDLHYIRQVNANLHSGKCNIKGLVENLVISKQDEHKICLKEKVDISHRASFLLIVDVP